MRKTKVKESIVRAIIPPLMHYLAGKKIITEDIIDDPEKLVRVFRKNIKRTVAKFPLLISLDSEFAGDAFQLWERGHHLSAIVLFATAVEQAINMHYRVAFLASGLKNDDITAIIRTQNLESKLGWLMKVTTKSVFPKALGKRLRIIAEVRNSIVHYKAIPGQVDAGDDSYSMISKRIKQMGRVSLRRDYRLLKAFLNDTLITHDPTRLLAHRAATKLLNDP